MTLVFALLPAAMAALPPDASLTYDVTIAGKQAGTRTVTVRWEATGSAPARSIEAYTELHTEVLGQKLDYRQRLTGWATTTPASFHSVVREGDIPREIQASWHATGWTVTLVDRTRARTADVPGYRLDLSTVDLMDPGSRYPLDRYTTLRLLSAETGDIWEGTVARLPDETVQVGRDVVALEGFSWTSPEGRHEYWYDTEGFLVRFRTRVMGIKVEGLLQKPPPPGPDVFPVRLGMVQVVSEEI